MPIPTRRRALTGDRLWSVTDLERPVCKIERQSPCGQQKTGKHLTQSLEDHSSHRERRTGRDLATTSILGERSSLHDVRYHVSIVT